MDVLMPQPNLGINITACSQPCCRAMSETCHAVLAEVEGFAVRGQPASFFFLLHIRLRRAYRVGARRGAPSRVADGGDTPSAAREWQRTQNIHECRTPVANTSEWCNGPRRSQVPSLLHDARLAFVVDFQRSSGEELLVLQHIKVVYQRHASFVRFYVLVVGDAGETS